MNKKHVFDGKDWIGISGEIVVTPLHGTRPMHPALSKKLYDKNAKKFTKPAELLYFGLPANLRYVFPYEITPFKIVPGRIPPQLKDIATTITTIDKYTIVELTHNNKHYHGLASRADCDKENAVSGIAVAYHRAFEKMIDDIKIGVATYNKNSSKIQGRRPNTVVLDDDLSPIGKVYFKNKDWVSYDLPCEKLKEIWGTKKFNASTYRQSLKKFSEDTPIDDIINKQSKLVDKAISDLLTCTDVELRQYDLKTVHGAKDALEEISIYGYKIYELQNRDPLKLTYVLQRCDVEITRRDINIRLTQGDKQK